MDQLISDSDDGSDMGSDWETSEEQLIPVDDDHITDEMHEAEQRADAALEADEARLEQDIEAFEQDYGEDMLVQPAQADQLPGSDSAMDDDTPPSASLRGGEMEVVVSERGLGERIETGPEKPERTVWGVIPEGEMNSGGSGERLG
ncbi:MAG: hypothetical protein H0S79_19840 [Anaerolineaceae bacterium]|nr:hypothetical protein [Anaerolineaceae bacterium]